ncbi:hypothetical protein EVB94_094 [Rhizobium phage RHph_TM40]|uniref:Uncharacterized protein n=1 Tax=Rhizobium phage RHph_TM30 TaxID=2509764 RepID=A0A7S5R4V9_9CAUD|nr:hypothetical protein PQC16_gp094 [Rhizobium phage RHph_TM30]QIG71201.1 hypothetical protein EVB93_094 [Rhizobium phage RHph_TM30]QIG71565.1 hypothetical protein EVB94_094 [Rhizobium phage RHph_TM40]QIG71928.1 hypothetical protein EVB95_094 [Rhizobium phage RHph_TM2_3B]QIG72290.1 hypothetical protein EVB96_094 [Rhizobium phage RHph_TM3_3_6]
MQWKSGKAMSEERKCPPGITWRDPEYLKFYTPCDVCKKYGDEGSPIHWVGGSSCTVCSRPECEEIAKGWYEDTARHVEEQLAETRRQFYSDEDE